MAAECITISTLIINISNSLIISTHLEHLFGAATEFEEQVIAFLERLELTDTSK